MADRQAPPPPDLTAWGPEVAQLDEVKLLAEARAGSNAAFGLLYAEYRPEAVRRARRMLGRRHLAAAEDLVEVAFAAIFGAIRNGKGPRENFAGYLMVTIRHKAWRTVRALEREAPMDLPAHRADESPSPEDLVVSGTAPRSEDPAAATMADLGRSAGERLDPTLLLTDAFRSLKDRYRSVLWMSEVEHRSPAELGEMLGMSANTAAALCYRARRALRSAYFARYAATSARPECVPMVPRLEAFASAGFDAPGFDDVADHTAWCSSCRDVLRGVAQSGSVLGAAVPFGLLFTGRWLHPDPPGSAGAGHGRALRSARTGALAGVAAVAVLVVSAIVVSGSTGTHPGQADASPAPRDPSTVAAPVPPGASSVTPASVPTTAPRPAGEPTLPEARPAPGAPPPSAAPTPRPTSPVPPASVPAATPAPPEREGGLHGRLALDPDGTGPDAVRPAGGVPMVVTDAVGDRHAMVTSAGGRWSASDLPPGPAHISATLPTGLVAPGSDGAGGAPTGPTYDATIGTVEVARADAAVDDIVLQPQRRLAAGSGRPSRDAAVAGEDIAWQFDLSSAPVPTSDVVATFTLPDDGSARLGDIAVTIDGRAVGCRDRSTAGGLVVDCMIGRLLVAPTVLEVRVSVEGGQGIARPLLGIALPTGYAHPAVARGAPVAVG